MHLRSYREKSKDGLNRDFFNVPLQETLPVPSDPPSVVKVRHREAGGAGLSGMDINAVFSVEGKEEVYVSWTLCMDKPVGPGESLRYGGDDGTDEYDRLVD